MAKEIRVFGPPGTGKTSKIANEIVPGLVAKYGADKIMITSFTKSAAQELSARIKTDNKQMIGTLHSICFQALNSPSLTEEHLKEWDGIYPRYSFTSDAKIGPRCYAAYQILRNKIISRDSWRGEVVGFANRWDKWKKKYNYLDFIDLIEEAGKLFTAPGNPKAIIIDEAQDFTKLEMEILRFWAINAKEFWVTGDEDQNLYFFSGSDPRNMLEPPVPDDQKIILGQSYRIPRAVHTVAERIVKKITIREPKTYLPRDADGKVIQGDGNYETVDWAINQAQKIEGTSMFIMSCNYMLLTLIKILREKGIPFSNPWRLQEKNWNPLNTKGRNTLLSFLETGNDKPYWTVRSFIDWAAHIKIGPTGLIRKQGKAGIKQLTKILEEDSQTLGLHTSREFLSDILSPDAIEPALNRDVVWLNDNITKTKKNTLQYPLKIYNKLGKNALFEQPKLFVGTIHSTKGAEADNVFLYPDISYQSVVEMATLEGRENIYRLFYVGVTRTRENLFLMRPYSKYFFKI